jgi:hypothetical protein
MQHADEKCMFLHENAGIFAENAHVQCAYSCVNTTI